jgi:alkanesulfonate monooxygenase SsuD/methylene tetrahydromethanopterin reductase-like flavin-dependent oxidoreductase (luciferase family)
MELIIRYYDQYREEARRLHGYEAGPECFGWTSMVYLAEDSKKAKEEARPHVRYFAERCLVIPPQMLIPPGYTTAKSLRGFLESRPGGVEFDVEETLASDETLIGTPDEVGERLVRNMDRAGAGIFMGAFQVGDMPHAKVMKNLELFATRVMPYLPKSKPRAEAASRPA